MFKAIRVPRKFAEDVRKLVEKSGIKDKRRRIISVGEFVEIPIVNISPNVVYSITKSYPKLEVVEQDNPEFSNKVDLQDALKDRIPHNLLKYSPKSYKIIGDIILVKIHKKLEKYVEEIGKALLDVHPHCKAVWWDRGKRGMLRKPDILLIAGKGNVTIHRENGCLFKLDVSKVMFSPGNQAERIRMGYICKKGEIVVDMFAGIGYFSIPMCVHSKVKVYAIEINPESYSYLLENIKLNNAKKIIPILGDSMYVTPEGVADRVVMGHINCHEFLPVAIKALKNKGYIHYHESVPECVIERPIRRVISAAKTAKRNVKIIKLRKIKNYSPGVVHVVVDALVF